MLVKIGSQLPISKVKNFFMIDLLIDFSSSVNLEKFRIINFPSLIFFCGGIIPDNNSKYLSLRHYMFHYFERNNDAIYKKIILAEKVNDWYRFNHYTDLLSFEKDLAGLTSLIILFVESPGSIAELGAFSQIEEINKRLIVFVNTNFYEVESSFIKNGPLTYLEQKSDDIVYVYSWDVKNIRGKEYLDTTNLEIVASQISEAISSRLESRPDEPTFDKKNTGHIILLICDFIQIINISKKSDITGLLEHLGLIDVKKNVDKYLFILEKIKLIKRFKYGNDDYCTSNIDYPLIRYAYTDDSKIKDRLAWKLFLRDWIINNDKRRKEALDHSRKVVL
jgi:hypothetical protein